MKQVFCSVCALSLLLLGGFIPPAIGQQTVDDMTAMTAVVQQSSLEDFLQAIETNQWKVPIMFSRWHVEHVAAEEEQPALFAARAFGKALADRLVDWKAVMTADIPPEQLQQEIERVFELADWLTEVHGYGNLMLAARCHDITTVGIGQLIVNLQYPLENTMGLLHQLEAPAWNAPSVRQQVLNLEAGVDLFVSDSTQEAEIQRYLEETWEVGDLILAGQEVPDIQASLEGNPPEDAPWWLKEPEISELYQQASPLLKGHVGFFKDDVFPDVITTVNMWECKKHYRLIIGFSASNVSSLQALATFRATVGYFPTTPEYEDDFYRSPIEMAFAQTWERLETPETRNLDAPASIAYEAIISGTFFDADTREEMLAGQ